MTSLPGQDPADLDALEAGRRLRAGTLTAGALLDACLARVRARDGTTRAFWELTEDRARAAAATCDRDLAAGIDRGPLMGIPFAVKDTADMAGLVTTCGSAAMPIVPARRDAATVARLCERGAVPVGKVATYDLGTVGPSFDLPRPPARNPWNPLHITGGSSSGSAAAVAGGLVRLALGSDTAGSIRSPASYCGCVGLKTTRGLVPAEGVFSLAPSLLDSVGPLAATAAEAALMLDALVPGMGIGAAEGIGRGVEGMRLGYARSWVAGDPACDPVVLRALDEAASALSVRGARIEEVELPDYPLLEAAGAVLIHVEGLGLHRESLRRDLPHGREAYKSLAAGVVLEEADYAAAVRLAPRLQAGVDAVLEGRDAILTATTLTPAPPFAAFEAGAVWTPMRTLPFNVTGHPAVSVPCGFSAGLPFGLQVVGRWNDEATILRVAAAFEAATDHGALRPPL